MNVPITYIGENRFKRLEKLLTIGLIAGLVLIGAIIGFSLALQLIGSLEVTPYL